MDNLPSSALPSIPAKRYFTIGEVGDLCGVKPHVLRYWEQEFTQLRPMKRRGNRRYYQHHEVLMIRRIRDLLYDQGFTISGARNRLQELVDVERNKRRNGEVRLEGLEVTEMEDSGFDELHEAEDALASSQATVHTPINARALSGFEVSALASSPLAALRKELLEIRELLREPENTAIIEG
jgi:DNA-binding transcriptional MerR regulator